MKRLRLFVVLALAAAPLALGAAPASACQPDGPCPCAEDPTKTINNTWNKLTGDDFIRCTF
ncbi:MAG TPA: hypothetical protein VEV43_09565 [Actinomycetota bacterium]|nr:hypothetical protein [Actinomycetota bacterium]